MKSRGDVYNWEVGVMGVIPSLTKPVTTNPHEFEVQGADSPPPLLLSAAKTGSLHLNM